MPYGLIEPLMNKKHYFFCPATAACSSISSVATLSGHAGRFRGSTGSPELDMVEAATSHLRFFNKVLYPLDGAEPATHGADTLFTRFSFFVITPHLLGVYRKLFLSLPIKSLSSRRLIHILLNCLLVSSCNISGMTGNPCGDHSFPDIIDSRQLEML
jgi:hypothetical protein